MKNYPPSQKTPAFKQGMNALVMSLKDVAARVFCFGGFRQREPRRNSGLQPGELHLKLLLMFMAISFFSVSCMQTVESAIDETEASLAPDFKLQDINQDTVTLSSYRDKQPVLLLFWTTWCPFCREQIRTVNAMYPVLVKDGLEVLMINLGESDYTVNKFAKSYNVVYRILLDKDTKVATAYGILGVPTYIFIDKKGHIRFEENYFPKEKYKALISE